MPNCESFEPHPQPGQIWEDLNRRFGLTSGDFREYRLWRHPDRPTIWIAQQDLGPSRAAQVESMGIPVMRHPPPRGLPTTAFLQRFGHLARKSVLQVQEEAITSLMLGYSLNWCENGLRDGPFILRCGWIILGRGWIRNGNLHLDAPKEWRKSLQNSRS